VESAQQRRLVGRVDMQFEAQSRFQLFALLVFDVGLDNGIGDVYHRTEQLSTKISCGGQGYHSSPA
jgi:hypothetical protein